MRVGLEKKALNRGSFGMTCGSHGEQRQAVIVCHVCETAH